MKKNILKFITLLAFSLNVQAMTSEEQTLAIEKLDERLTDTELRTLGNKINLGMDLKIESTYMTDKVKFADNGERLTNNQMVSGILFRLRLDVPVSDDLRAFAAAESMSFFNQSLYNTTPTDGKRESQVKGDGVIISKAYFDWAFYDKWLILTAGRMPTTLGPPAYLKDGTNREGTYPITAFSFPLDGFALTSKISRPFNMKDDLSIRAIVTPGGVVDAQFPFRGLNRGDPVHPKEKFKAHKIVSAMIEYEQTEAREGLWDKMLAILEYTTMQLASFPMGDVSLPGSPDIYKLYFLNDIPLKGKVLSTYIEFQKLFKSEFDFYATAYFSDMDARGSRIGLTARTGAAAGTNYDILGETLHGGVSQATKVMFGSRYEFPRQYFAGGEFMHGSSKALGTAHVNNSIFNPNFLTGTSYELFGYKKMYNNNFIVRLAFTHVNVTKDISNHLNMRDVDEKINVGYLSFNLKI
jgi:hypothetical protein